MAWVQSHLLHLLAVTLGKLLSFSEPQSPHLLNGDNNSTFIINVINTCSFTRIKWASIYKMHSIVVHPFVQGTLSKTPSGCLKPGTVPNSMYTGFSYTHGHVACTVWMGWTKGWFTSWAGWSSTEQDFITLLGMAHNLKELFIAGIFHLILSDRGWQWGNWNH